MTMFTIMFHCILTGILIMVLLCAISRPKYTCNRFYRVIITAMVGINVLVNAWYYQKGCYYNVIRVNLLLLILLEVFIYASIFYGMNALAREYALREENLKIQDDRNLLHLAASSMGERLKIMEDSVAQHRIADHDRRHLNHLLLELLRQGQVKDAVILLQRQAEMVLPREEVYCKNTTINILTQ